MLSLLKSLMRFCWLLSWIYFTNAGYEQVGGHCGYSTEQQDGCYHEDATLPLILLDDVDELVLPLIFEERLRLGLLNMLHCTYYRINKKWSRGQCLLYSYRCVEK